MLSEGKIKRDVARERDMVRDRVCSTAMYDCGESVKVTAAGVR